MSIFRMASFSASYALFLKLVSGTIRTTAISASAMLNVALVGMGSTLAYLKNKEPQRGNFWHTTCQNVKLPLFSAFPRLDKFVSGIPNAIATNSHTATHDPHRRHQIKSEFRRVMDADASMCLLRRTIEVTEEANVEFQRCGPQSPGCSQGGQTHVSDGAGRQAGLRCLWHPGSQRGRRQVGG